ncbi:MAG: IS21 family transposase [Clostridiales Family XIII bacterium]|jgi:predicted transcriptional regulator|nr:IS21 family transposase [Clostridiales Family XIII bacterium]
MISDEQYKLIRQSQRNGLSQRQTAKLCGFSRKTVAKYWNGATLPRFEYLRPSDDVSSSKNRKNNIINMMSEYIKQNAQYQTKKQKITKKMVYNYVNRTISISYPSICRYYNELQLKKPEIYIPLEFEPGEVMQVDFCEVVVEIESVRYKCKLFCAVLGYSGKIFTMLLPNEKQNCFFYAHKEAFNYFNGIPKVIFYDNCRVAVEHGSGKNAVVNKNFNLLRAHYGFESNFMNAARGNEKGLVENLCQHIRKLAFTPIPVGKNLKEIQESSLLKIEHYNNTHTKRYQKQSISDMAEIEKIHLYPLPLSEFQSFEPRLVTADKFLMFNYKNNKYSVPFDYANEKILVQSTPYEIFCKCKGQLIATHTIPLTEGNRVFDVEHYIPLLIKKRRSIQHAQPLKYGEMPSELKIFRSKCKDKNKLEQILDIFLLSFKYERTEILKAVSEANKNHNNPNYQIVLTYLQKNINIDYTDYNYNYITEDNTDIEKNNPLNDYDSLIETKNEKNK